MKAKRVMTWGLLAAVWGLAALGPAAAQAPPAEVKVRVALGNAMLISERKHTVYLKVGLTGFAVESEDRAPVNMAIVLDKSGSMQGEKIARAKEAVIMALDRLGSDDIVSVVTYDNGAHVLVPATKLSDRQAVYTAVRSIQASGSTALFAGVSKGAAEVRKFIHGERFNRVILLSDGLANVGPQSPAELGQLGSSLIKEGISITTLGLGLDYNEDLMTRLAFKSDGNHYFAKTPGDLTRIFSNEFGRVIAVAAQKVRIDIHCEPGVRPVRVLGREADIVGQRVTTTMNQLYSQHEKYLILEVEAPAGRSGTSLQLAAVNVRYENMRTKARDELRRTVSARYTDSSAELEQSVNAEVMADAVELLATAKNKLAIALRDRGSVDEAKKAFRTNEEYLRLHSKRYKSEKLEEFAKESGQSAGRVDDEALWREQRKSSSEGDMVRIKQ